MAWFRIAQAKGLLVLGSATPDLKTFYAVREAKIPVSTLPARVGGGTLPSIRLVDIRSMNCVESILAPETLSALKQTVEQGDQAVILLNRRGYAPLMYCIDCGKVARCPHCDIGLTYHKGRERLVCHYCGYSVPSFALPELQRAAFPSHGAGNRACRRVYRDASASGRPGSALGSGQHSPPGAHGGDP